MSLDGHARLERIERHYARSPFVRELCVVAGPALAPGSRPAIGFDTASGSGLQALVVADEAWLRSRRIVGVSDWVRFEFETLSATLAAADRIESAIVRFAPLPRSSGGEVNRWAVARTLAEAATTATDQPPATAGDPRDDVAQRVLSVVSRASGRTAWTDAHLDVDLGLDSIARVELVVALERELGVAVDEAAASAAATAGELVEAIRAAVRAAPLVDHGPWRVVLARPAREAGPGDETLAGRPLALSVLTYLLLLLIRWTARAAIGLRAEGLEHVPRRGPFLLCPNHQTLVDGFLISALLPFGTWHRLFFVGASEYYATPASAWFAHAIGIVPIDADANLPGGLRAAAGGLRAGRILMLFPEGERSIDGRLKRFRLGGPLLATALAVPVVPVGIEGAFAWWPRGQRFAWPRLWRRGTPPVRVRFGAVMVPATPGVPAEAAAFAEALRDRVARLALPGGEGPT